MKIIDRYQFLGADIKGRKEREQPQILNKSQKIRKAKICHMVFGQVTWTKLEWLLKVYKLSVSRGTKYEEVIYIYILYIYIYIYILYTCIYMPIYIIYIIIYIYYIIITDYR